MRAELRSLDYFESDLSSFEEEAFCVNVIATIGAVGERGGDDFTFEVCSPAWLRSALETDEVVSGQYRLIMAEFDFPALERFVAKRVGQTEGSDWNSIATKLAAWSRWEFEGMTPP
ncbi:Imm8 family immunity protein [Qipengyuania sp. G39]|uniref:Imm8 family immunity protein n=1 Tax=Qipengyuania profundimaris TaxID=3067652 RepID=A0ABT9HQ00_9SPHN|nr:Imm8 family immunity protein [Qipengyuania sp. G39]MDP4574803.1 Imm8 family immunity protein [Qipengyuania sp. G39]